MQLQRLFIFPRIAIEQFPCDIKINYKHINIISWSSYDLRNHKKVSKLHHTIRFPQILADGSIALSHHCRMHYSFNIRASLMLLIKVQTLLSEWRHFVGRCVCPGHTVGHFCKITSRSFSGNGWAWLSPLPPCSPTRLSLQFLTSEAEGLILYSGPLSSKHSSASRVSSLPNSNNRDMNYVKAVLQHHYQTTLAIQLTHGKLQVVLDSRETGSLAVTVNSTYTLNDGRWHSIHLRIAEQVTVFFNFRYIYWSNLTL